MAGWCWCFLVLALYAVLGIGLTQCPGRLSANCRCTSSSQGLEEVTCGNYGQVSSLPSIGEYALLIQHVTVYNASVSTLQAQTFSNLLIHTLTLSQLKIESIHPDAFVGLEAHLEELWLDFNSLTQLTSGGFRTLSTLQNLHLNNNLLTVLQSDHFNGLTALKTLDLCDNELTDLPDGVFNQLTSLTSLKLCRNNIKTVSENLLTSLPQLSALDLSSNVLSRLPPHLFRRLSRLHSVSLAHNQLQELPAVLFEDAVELNTLNLAENNISSLETGIFSQTNKLSILNLSTNSLFQFPAPVFIGLGSLQELYMDNNKLQFIQPFAFEDLSAVEVLHLHNNNITELPEGMLEGMIRIKELILRNNSVISLANAVFDRLDSLITLDLSHNKFTELPFAPFASQRNLEYVDLSHNQVRNIQADLFKKNLALKILLLNNNKIKYIEKGSFDSLQSLTHLELFSNRIPSLNETLFNLASLINLSLSQNPISYLTLGSFYGMQSVERLYLDNCCFTDIPNNVFQDMTSLKELHLENTPISTVHIDSFKGLRKLEYLNMSYCNISSVEGSSFRYFGKVQKMNLDHNSLTSDHVRHILYGPYAVQFLDMSYNQLTKITNEFKSLSELTELRLAGNPAHCTCETVWLRSYLPFTDFSFVWCESPQIDAGYLLACSPVPFGCDTVQESPAVNQLCRENPRGNQSFSDSPSLSDLQTYPVCYYEEETTSQAPDMTTALDMTTPIPYFMELKIDSQNENITLSWHLLSNFSDITGFWLSAVRYTKKDELDPLFFINTKLNHTTSSFTLEGLYWKKHVACITIILADMNDTLPSTEMLPFPNTTDRFYRLEVNHTNGICSEFYPEEKFNINIQLDHPKFPTLPLGIGLGVFGLALVLLIIWVVGRRYNSSSGRQTEETPKDLGKNTTYGQQDHMVDEITMSWDTLTSPHKNGKVNSV